jgi:ADP-heptose:LPS heptosyltransferase
MLALRKMLRGARFERVYDLQNSARTAFYYHWFLRGVPWSGTAAGCSLPHRHPAPKTVPVLERLAGQFADAGVPVRHTPHPDLSWAADPVDELLARAWVSAPFVLLLAGSSARNPQKRWPYYPQLAEWLIAEGIQVVTAPGPDEIALCRMIPGTMLTVGDEAGGKGSGKGSGKGIGRHLDFFKLAGVIRAARLVVGNDSGPTHLAAHLGVPGIALFGGHTSSALTGIARPNMTILEETPLADLSVERVHAAVLDRLGIAAEVPSGL